MTRLAQGRCRPFVSGTTPRFEDEDLGVVDEPVDRRGSTDLVTEYLIPGLLSVQVGPRPLLACPTRGPGHSEAETSPARPASQAS